MNVNSLNQGDGKEEDSSFWLYFEGGCVVSGILEERFSPFFIPSLINVTLDNTSIPFTLHFTGALLIPCDLTFSLLFSFPSSSSLPYTSSLHSFSSFVNESNAVGTVEPSDVVQRRDGEDLFVVLNLGLNSSSSSSSSKQPKYLLINGAAPPSDDTSDDENMREDWEEDGTVDVIVLVVVWVCVCVVMLAVVGGCVVHRKISRQLVQLEGLEENVTKSLAILMGQTKEDEENEEKKFQQITITVD